jgi:hypothetical protein
MTASKTATVETLTAEVRVLMVGSRQVTLSVYGQLDTAEYEDAELFGRVSPKAAEHGYAEGGRPVTAVDVRAKPLTSMTTLLDLKEHIGGGQCYCSACGRLLGDVLSPPNPAVLV